MLLWFAALFVQTASAQDGRVTITVVDSHDEPLIGVTVLIKSTQLGGSTDINGVIKLNAASTDVIEASYIGYETTEVVLGTRTSLKIVMPELSTTINEVVVIGYGIQKKETVTGSISQVSGNEIVQSPTANISNALVGRVSGLSSVQKSGEAGFDETTIRIRGTGTYNGDQNPLVVIDGVIRDITSFNMLNNNDIEGINVLKDASATAVYGVRGANGVIIVSTKQGKTGRAKVSFLANFGLTKPTTLVDFVDSYNYATLKNEAYYNDNKSGSNKIFTEDELWKFKNNRDYTPAEIENMSALSDAQKEALRNSPAAYYTDTDYMSAIFGSSVAPQQQYNINISGGTDKVGYYTSVGLLDQRSLTNDFGFSESAANSGSSRMNFRTNFDFKMIKNTEIKLSLSGQMRDIQIITDRNGSSAMGSRYHDLLLNVYEAPPYSGIGIYGDKLIGGYADDGMMINKNAWGKTPIAYMLEKSQSRISQSSLNTSININHKMDYIVEGLTLRGALSYDHYFSKTLLASSNVPRYTFTRNPSDPAELLFFGGEREAQSYSESGWSKNRKFYMEYGLDYAHSFGRHSVTAMALVTGERYTANGLTYNVPVGYYGIVGRVTYAYDSRYFVEYNMGYNGSENFAPERRFGFFPAVSLGWALSNEPFFPQNDYVSWVKIRGSYGQTGNSNIGGSRFMYLPGTWAEYGYSNPMQGYAFGSSDGTTTNPVFNGKYELTTGNPFVTWERKESYNVGLDMKFFKDRLSFTADLFKEDRNNILTTLEIVSGVVGLDASSLPPVNVGKMSNKGYEIELLWNDNIGSKFNYRIGGNISYAVNNIIYKAEPSYQYVWMNDTGFAYGQYKGLYNEGFYNSAEEVANHPYNDVDGNKVQGGDLRIVDINGDGLIDSKDYVPVGYSNIPRMTFSSNLSVAYNGLRLSLLFTGTSQGSFAMKDYLITPFAQDQSTPLSYMAGRWTSDRYLAGDQITFPRMSVNIGTSQNNGDNAFWIRSTDHIKLKNVELAYSFKEVGLLKRLNISGLTVYFNANNLLTWTFGGGLIDGIDPELTGDSTTSGGLIYPLTRVYNIGFNVDF